MGWGWIDCAVVSFIMIVIRYALCNGWRRMNTYTYLVHYNKSIDAIGTETETATGDWSWSKVRPRTDGGGNMARYHTERDSSQVKSIAGTHLPWWNGERESPRRDAKRWL